MVSSRASLVGENWRSILVAIFLIISRDLTNLQEILLDGPSRFEQATLNKSVPCVGRRRHRVIYATCSYLTRKNNYVIGWNRRRSSALLSAWPDDRLMFHPIMSMLQVSYKSAATSIPTPLPLRDSTAFIGTTARIRTLPRSARTHYQLVPKSTCTHSQLIPTRVRMS